MQGFITNIEISTLNNTDYRRVLYTSRHAQLVLMSIDPGEEIGDEVHHLDQFIRFEQGQARVTLDGVSHDVAEDWAVMIPAGMRHNVVNVGTVPLKLYSVYAPPEHKEGTVHPTKGDVVEEPFDGTITEG